MKRKTKLSIIKTKRKTKSKQKSVGALQQNQLMSCTICLFFFSFFFSFFFIDGTMEKLRSLFEAICDAIFGLESNYSFYISLLYA